MASFVGRSGGFKKQCRRCIGDGRETTVLNSPWLLRDEDPYIRTPLPSEWVDMKVADLVILGTKSWNRDLIHAIFLPEDSQAICNIPLCQSIKTDRWMWTGDRNRRYTVKQGYRVAHNDQAVGGNLDKAVWQGLFRLNVPPKVRNFIWRGMHEVLLVRANLVRKGVSITTACPRCLSIEETTLHGLVLCPFAVRCLREVGGERGNVEPSFALWFAALWKESSREFVACVAIILWEIWTQRNQLVWNNKYMQPKTLVARALQWYQSWQQAKQEDLEVARTRNTFHNQWEPPVHGALKCNVDANFNPNTHLARVGMVVRDSNGYFVKGASRGLGQVEDACMAEAIGVREALSWLKGIFRDRIITLEMDNQTLYFALQEREENFSYFSGLVFDCKTLMSEFYSVSLSFVRRSANEVAHLLARASDFMHDLLEWDDTPPTIICDVLQKELRI
ncbi:unnamed protein product [Cuscuta campestris]|uniref:RNase H type-1 domain-containing protein n=1 Tax=Cuscuta campestris TaxID=132261 RepID=A0A484K2C0_9ASTE|nr:unnamed protein product [Cuscuta campestris]